jgi:hypothetical protein
MSGIVQILIFEPGGHKESTEERQRRINLAIEQQQVNNDFTVRDVVLGTNNYVYIVGTYPDK